MSLPISRFDDPPSVDPPTHPLIPNFKFPKSANVPPSNDVICPELWNQRAEDVLVTAYSTDFNQRFIDNVRENMSRSYDAYANVYLDGKPYFMQTDATFEQWYKDPIPPPTSPDSETPSNALEMIQNYLYIPTERPCGHALVVLIKRLPEVEDDSLLLALIKRAHVNFNVIISTSTLGTDAKSFWCEIASKVNGLCFFDEEKNFVKNS
ncbi:hypothetical protein CRE_23138 [Caenorhabditis remanei]|uniref:Uncharacterized protein n=1 Tax=Caenorhabditis remanei TaxID=31234 RepID=E3NFW7_CAERE|nr:hypothetical protein CRE_23138 [Caenorhabditis remanei]